MLKVLRGRLHSWIPCIICVLNSFYLGRVFRERADNSDLRWSSMDKQTKSFEDSYFGNNFISSFSIKVK